MFEGSKTPLNLHLEIWILQFLMSPDLNFWYQPTVYILKAWKDPYGALQNPYFLELQQKYAEGEQNCPYVMASRVQELEQLYILEELPKEKIYANQAALSEIERLIKVSKNKNPSKWLSHTQEYAVRVIFLNCRSIKNKFYNILSDGSLLHSDVIILTETWLDENDDDSSYNLPGYEERKRYCNILQRGKVQT